jgi:hypothetical protein
MLGPARGRSIAWHSVSKASRDPIVATIAAHQKAAAALMVALKCKLQLEDNLGGKAYDGDDPNGSQRKKLKTRLGATERFNGASAEVAKLPQHSAFFARPPSDTR